MSILIIIVETSLAFPFHISMKRIVFVKILENIEMFMEIYAYLPFDKF